VLHRRGKVADLHPAAGTLLAAGDELTLFADVPTLKRLRRLAESA